MADTLTTLTALVREQGNDSAALVWSDTQIQNALRRALQNSYPQFFLPVMDETTYAGSNALAQNTQEIAVPTAYLSDPANGRGNGFIDSIWCRIGNGSTNNSYVYPWFRLTKGLRIDPLNYTAPKIRFADLYSQQCELKIYGGVPTIVPTSTSTPIPVTEQPGCQAFLIAQSLYFLNMARIGQTQTDRRNHLVQSQLYQQEAEKWKKDYKMDNYYPTLFNKYGG